MTKLKSKRVTLKFPNRNFTINFFISTLFWADLASIHYSKKTVEWYEKNEVNFAPKSINPPNRSEERPIEFYWSIVKENL